MSQAPQRSSAAFAGEHPALLLSGLLITTSVLHVLVFASLDVPAALAILAVADRTSVLASTALHLIGFLTFVVLGEPRVRRWLLDGAKPDAPLGAKLRTATLIVPVCIILLSVTPALSVGLLLLLVLVQWILRLARRRGAPRITADGQVQVSPETGDLGVWLTVLAVGLNFSTSLALPWVPLERLNEAGQDDSIIGYVVGEQSGLLLIAPEEERSQLLWAAVDRLEERIICDQQTETWTTVPIARMLDTSREAACDAAE